MTILHLYLKAEVGGDTKELIMPFTARFGFAIGVTRYEKTFTIQMGFYKVK